jgi:hypothetical protein
VVANGSEFSLVRRAHAQLTRTQADEDLHAHVMGRARVDRRRGEEAPLVVLRRNRKRPPTGFEPVEERSASPGSFRDGITDKANGLVIEGAAMAPAVAARALPPPRQPLTTPPLAAGRPRRQLVQRRSLVAPSKTMRLAVEVS